MLLELFLAVIAGITCGIFTGLIPGLHVNLITAIVVGSASMLAGISPFLLSVFILSLALTHSFLDSIPSIYLGAPDADQVLSVLPGHQMLLEGRGHHAVTYTLVGSFAALILTIIFFPLGLQVLEPAQSFLEPYVGKLLLAIILFLLIMSRKFLLNTVFFLTAGLLGLLCFSLVHQQHILLPLLSGLFGTSTLILSLNSPSHLPEQDCSKTIPLKFTDIENTVSRATFVGMLASFLPGFGSSQAAIVASATMKRKTPRDYLLLVGGINTVNFAFSLVTITLLGKARNGAVLGMSNLLETITTHHLHIFVPVLLVTGGVAVILGLTLSKKMSRLLQKVDYHKLVIGVILFLLLVVIILSGVQGVLILVTATALGLLAAQYGAQKNMLLGCLILPVILYLW
ncbi:MAG: tripartite tricarboxylate transporter permease [Candidatus Woesearchaeota archaeon]